MQLGKIFGQISVRRERVTGGEGEGEGDYAVLPRNDFTVQVRLDQLSPRSAARGKNRHGYALPNLTPCRRCNPLTPQLSPLPVIYLHTLAASMSCHIVVVLPTSPRRSRAFLFVATVVVNLALTLHIVSTLKTIDACCLNLRERHTYVHNHPI